MRFSPTEAVLLVVAVAFFLNLLWEVLHSMLYDWNAPPLVNDIYRFIPRITGFATLLDAVWIACILLINAARAGGFDWIYEPGAADYATVAACGVASAVLIELAAIRFNMWRYHRRMPLVFGMGLTPLVQLALTGCASLYIVSGLVLR